MHLRHVLLASHLGLITLSMASTPALAGKGGRIPELTKDGRPNIQSIAALVVDLVNGKILYEKDPDLPRPVASLSKMMGAIVIMQECKLDPDGLHEMTVANREGARGGDKSKLTTGWQYSHRDLLHAALMRSDNRALPALGEACGMDTLTFGQRMTAKARSLGLTTTFFEEPNGLSSRNVSTAREMLTILREALRMPSIATIMTTPKYMITGIRKGMKRSVEIRNTDRLLSRKMVDMLGGKTGYTDPARYCFAGAARLADKREVGMVFLGAEGRYTRFADFSRTLFWLNKENSLASSTVPTIGPAPASLKPASKASFESNNADDDGDDDGDAGSEGSES